MSSHLLVEFRRLSIDCPSAMNEWLCRYVWIRQETQQLHGLRLSHLQEVVTWGRVATNLLSPKKWKKSPKRFGPISFLCGFVRTKLVHWFGFASRWIHFSSIFSPPLSFKLKRFTVWKLVARKNGSMFLPYDQLRRVCATVYVIPLPTWGPSGWIHRNWPVLMKPKKTSKPRKTPETKSRGLVWWKVGCKVFTSGFSSKHLSFFLACLKRKGEEWQYYFNQRWPNVTGEFISPCRTLLSCKDMFACIPIEQLITPFHMIRQNSPEERLDCAFELRGFHSIPARHTFLNAFLQHMSPRDVSSRPSLRGMNLEHDSFEHAAWKCRGHTSWRRFLF